MTSAEAIALIEAAHAPGDLFAGDAARCYRRLARLTHPDVNRGDSRCADAFAKLTALWQRHQGETGLALARGDIANLYRVRHHVLKLARDPADNDLMRREAAALTRLQAGVEPRLQAYFPWLAGAQRRQDPCSGVQRRANVIGWLGGFRSLAEVRNAFPGGLDPRDAAWMWRRLLAGIGAAHRAGVIHGAVLPEHVMIHPADHGLVIVDWCYSSSGPAGRLPAIVARYRDWYPPEVLALTHLDTTARHPLRLCRSYQVDGQRLERITPGPARDLRWQEQLTRMLLRATPSTRIPAATGPGSQKRCWARPSPSCPMARPPPTSGQWHRPCPASR